jgi:hypothetical protein
MRPDPWNATPRGGGFGAGASPPPRDILIILGVVFGTFALQFFSATAVVPALLGLGPWLFRGAVWQLLTYPFVGGGPVSLWFLVSLLLIFLFGRDVYWRVGRTRFWSHLIQVTATSGVVAALIEALAMAVGNPSQVPFILMQGQYVLVTVFIATYATLFADRTILLFFVVPIQARWFIWIEFLVAVMGYLGTKDLGGFAGITTAIALSWILLRPGGPARVVDDFRLRTRRMWLEWRLARMRRDRDFDVIDGGSSGSNDYVH